MPLFYQHNINDSTKLAIWKITETENFLLEKVSMKNEVMDSDKRLQHVAGRYLLQILEPIQPLCIVEAYVIGNMQMIDTGLIDDKIIAVAVRDPTVNYITNLAEVPQHIFKVLKNYFEQYKVLENKKVEINDFQDKEKAFEIIDESIQFYKETFPK